MLWLVCYCLNRTDGTLVGRAWDGGTDVSRRRNGSATIASLGADGGGKRWLVPIVSVLQGRGVFFLKQQNNTIILHTNRN